MKSNTFTTDEHKYLQRLKMVALKPEIVYALGELPAASRLSVAIVGTRRPTLYGKKVSFDFAYSLAQQGITIVSGLAYGIDSAAHKGALAANGHTVAVVAHGLNSIYPLGHTQLAQQIVMQGGCIISEYPDGTPVMKHRFLERNRLVSGLADVLLVIEAGEQSGTSSTIQYALEQGKEVFAVPGPITSSASKGTNRLIQQGAHPALSPQDILEVIAPGRKVVDKPPTGDTEAETLLLTLIYKGVADTDTLMNTSALDSSTYAQTITILEIRGRIAKGSDGRWSVIR
jgi:DNA processing protein